MANTSTGTSFSNVAAGTYGPWRQQAGKYAIVWSATVSAGNAQLQILAPDGSTFVNAGASLTAVGLQIQDLPEATFQLVITTSTANYWSIARIGKDD